MNAQPGDAVVRLLDVTHRYASVTALDHASFAFPSGCVIGLIGPDGAGKSSLLSLIGGARLIQAGTIEVLGGSMADERHRTSVCPRIAYMPQGLGKNLYPDLSVRENIEFFARLFGQSKEERKQRITDLLVSRVSHRSGMSVLVATAYMEEAEHFDLLIAMDSGKILTAGPPTAIKAAQGARTIEEAFIALLPEALRKRRHLFQIPPRRRFDAESVIGARRLTRRFGDFTAVDDVSFTIERGEIFGLVGSNGCGKTTTMKMLTGLLPATAGEAQLFGRPVDASDMATRMRVGYMSQSFSLYTELTVRQNLELHARLFRLPTGKAQARILDLINRFGLHDYLNQLTTDLPLGIRRGCRWLSPLSTSLRC
jgi:ribosome-dependent ATPase